MTVRVTILGSGTSSGVPVVGCGCEVCGSQDPRNRRLRPGAMIEYDGRTVLIDTPTDLREQALRFDVERVDAVLYTHEHADHVLGLDELRMFNVRQGAEIPCFGPARALESIRQMFAYVFESAHEGGPRPRIRLTAVEEPFEAVEGLTVTPIPIFHGDLPIYGYRIGKFAYLTDCSRIPDASLSMLDDLEILVLGALRYRTHPTHFSIEQALAVADRLGAKRTYFTHLTHEVNHTKQKLPLPSGVELSWDGLVFDVGA